jgi:hypothetical protein
MSTHVKSVATARVTSSFVWLVTGWQPVLHSTICMYCRVNASGGPIMCLGAAGKRVRDLLSLGAEVIREDTDKKAYFMATSVSERPRGNKCWQ